MTEYPFVLAPFYKGWDVYQRHLVNALAPLSPDQLALRATQDLRSIGMIATHIVAARARWLYYVLKEGSEQLIPIGKWSPRLVQWPLAMPRAFWHRRGAIVGRSKTSYPPLWVLAP